MTLHKRLARMEAQRGPDREAVTVIFFCEPRTGEPGAALLMGGGGLVREPGETVDGFTARALGRDLDTQGG